MTLLGAFNPYALLAKCLAVVLLAAALFAGGYYVAVRQYETAAANAAHAASVAATQAQAKKDAADYAATKKDSSVRQAANVKAEVVYQTIYRDRKVLVPSPADCKVPAPAMKALNNPALIGDGQ